MKYYRETWKDNGRCAIWKIDNEGNHFLFVREHPVFKMNWLPSGTDGRLWIYCKDPLSWTESEFEVITEKEAFLEIL